MKPGFSRCTEFYPLSSPRPLTHPVSLHLNLPFSITATGSLPPPCLRRLPTFLLFQKIHSKNHIMHPGTFSKGTDLSLQFESLFYEIQACRLLLLFDTLAGQRQLELA